MRQLRKVFMTVRLMKADEVGGKGQRARYASGGAAVRVKTLRGKAGAGKEHPENKAGILWAGAVRDHGQLLCRWMASSVCWS